MKIGSSQLDRFQIAGFIVSLAVSLILISFKEDTVQSVSMGLIVALLTQLFDLQIRFDASTRTLLTAHALAKDLYSDSWLMNNIQTIVSSFVSIDGPGADFFRRRAHDAIDECRETLSSLADGQMVVDMGSRYALGIEAIASARTSIKHSAAIAEVSYWRTNYARSGLTALRGAIAKGVSITRIFIQDPDTIATIADILVEEVKCGIDVLIVSPQSIPPDLREDYLIVDDEVAATLQPQINGVGKQRITRKRFEIELMMARFDRLALHATRFRGTL